MGQVYESGEPPVDTRRHRELSEMLEKLNRDISEITDKMMEEMNRQLQALKVEQTEPTKQDREARKAIRSLYRRR